MSDVPQERTDLPQEPYRPFPTFAEFTATDVDLSTVAEFVAILEEAKAQATPEGLHEAVRRATKWAAVDTGAIEGLYEVDRGFTFTVAAEAAAWDAMQLQIGDAAARSINDALHAYDYVLDVVTDHRPITETWIKELHEVICASQDTFKVLTAIGMQEQPLPTGVYKTQPNNPFNLRSQALHGYAPVTDTPAEMHRMIEELGSDEFAEANPVVQAAYVHYAFVCIHPFADGNGRVARALASIYLYRSPGVPLVVLADQKGDYIDALEAADDQRYTSLIRFVADRAVDTVRAVADEVRQSHSTVDELRQKLEASQQALGGRSTRELQALSDLLLDEWLATLERSTAVEELSDIVDFEFTSYLAGDLRPIPPPGYLSSQSPRVVYIRAALESSSATADAYYAVGVARLMGGPSEFLVFDAFSATEPRGVVDALIRDVSPTMTSMLRYRLETAASHQLMKLAAEAVATSD